MVDALAKEGRTTEALSLVEVMTRRDLSSDMPTANTYSFTWDS